MYGFFCVYTYILISVSVYICGLKFLLHNVLKKRFKMRMMQYFKHIEYADKIFSFLLLFDVVYHISTNKRQRVGKRKAVKKNIEKN